MKMPQQPRALNLLRPALTYRREAFDAGLAACGFTVVPELRYPDPCDVLVIWNRYGGYHETAARFESRGAKVVVAENGYLRKSWKGGEWFSLSLWHHAGAGAWPNGPDARWDSFGVEPAPWREPGGEVVIFGQRGIGEPMVRCPNDWAEGVRTLTAGRIRLHPGENRNVPPLSEDLKNASAWVTWNSAAALTALLMGIPGYTGWASWIGASACTPVSKFKPGESPMRDDAARLRMFRRLAWAMWQLSEIRDGEAFRTLLAVADGG
jgi:hypothetical protein